MPQRHPRPRPGHAPVRPASAPKDPTETLRGILELTPAAPDPVTGQVRFTGTTPRQTHGRVFGGQVLAQALAAASRTVPAARSAHSLHGYFIRPGDALQPITFTVETLRDGRSFSVRRVLASQNEKAILALTCSFQEPAGSALDHQVAMPEGVPRPEDLPTTADVLGGINHPVAQEWAWARPFDIRHVTPALYVDPAPETENRNICLLYTSPSPRDRG